MEKKCLIISYYFSPDSSIGAKRCSLLSGYLSKKMKVIDVLTIKEEYIEEKDPTLIYGGNIYRTGYFPKYKAEGKKIRNRIMRKILRKILPIDNYSGWIIPAFFKGIKIIIRDHIDTIIVTNPPFSQFAIGYLLSILFKVKLILDYQDPWNTAADGFRSCWILEKLCLKRAEIIIFNTQIMMDNYLKLGLDFNIKEKSLILTNPFLQKEDIRTSIS